MAAAFSTHDVLNQPPPFEDVNLFLSDTPLMNAVKREGGSLDVASLKSFGQIAGSQQAQEWARLANEFPPVLKTHDSKGRRLDVVEFHPGYHTLMETSCKAGLTRLNSGPCAHVERSALLYLATQMEAGHCCPITMTNAALPVLARQVDIGAAWNEKARALNYDRRFLPMQDKTSVTLGMGMTEKQGGTDVRANTTRAVALSGGGPGKLYEITGHKWFMSAPMSDAFLVLAQAPGGLTCFLMPRFLPDGSVNALHFQRLKSKLGNRSNASSEVEFAGAHGWAIGAEGEGTKVIIEMVTATRLDCAVASAALMRTSLAQALHHTANRRVYQKTLIDQPLMQHVLADLALDAEAAVALAFRTARAFDAKSDPNEQAWQRLMTPVVKYWCCKTAPPFVGEAMECLGGNGYVEEGTMARIYREAPVNSIWEGSGNVMALDVVRVMQRDLAAAGIVFSDLREACKADGRLKSAAAHLEGVLRKGSEIEHRAREITEGFAVLAAGTLLSANAPPAIAEAYIASRFGAEKRATYGANIDATTGRAIVDRARPVEK